MSTLDLEPIKERLAAYADWLLAEARVALRTALGVKE